MFEFHAMANGIAEVCHVKSDGEIPTVWWIVDKYTDTWSSLTGFLYRIVQQKIELILKQW